MKNLISAFLFLLLSCGKDPGASAPNLTSEVDGLGTTEAKREYLEEIFESDQQLRLKMGDPKLSEAEKDELWAQQNQTDLLNLQKIEKYLEVKGYPGRTEVGEIAALAPWTVIHHQKNYQTRNRYFKPLYKAWLEENIDDNALSFYLNRTYEIKFGERSKMPGPYDPEEEIDLLIQKLDLEDEKFEVMQSFQ